MQGLTVNASGAVLSSTGKAARWVALDALRGLAIVLMMVDHVALVYGAPFGVREIITRLAMPLFMLLAGYLWRPGLRMRHLDLIVAAALSVPLSWLIGSDTVPILVVLVLVLPLMELAHRYPLALLVLAIVQPITWPIAWYGYQPGAILALLIVGHLMRWSRLPSDWLRVGERMPFLAPVGRWPLMIYVGHLVLLGALTY